jgi:hypothetical protein
VTGTTGFSKLAFFFVLEVMVSGDSFSYRLLWCQQIFMTKYFDERIDAV